ncbi:MAG: DUF4383 domain-containing protein [Actinomycetota bacterium]|nr:DUF4383 domain-containing protein [Actinomycetota bacterium]
MSYEYKGQTLGKTQAGAPAQRAPRRSPAGGGSAAGGRSLLQIFSAVVGLAFLLAGVGGFIPGITSNYDDLSLFGTDSNAELLGLFRVSILHNIVHLLFAIGLLAAARASLSKLYLIGGGVGYLGVFVYGLIVDHDSDANFLPLNDADNFLHLGLALGMIVLGVVGVAVAKQAVARA